MGKGLKVTLLMAILLPVCLLVRGQGLESLKPSSDILSGTLSNGVAYYLRPSVENAGTTDMAIVLKEPADTLICQYLAKTATSHKVYSGPDGRRAAEEFRFSGLRDSQELYSVLRDIFAELRGFSSGLAVLSSGSLASAVLRDSISLYAAALPDQLDESVTYSLETPKGLRVRIIPNDSPLSRISVTYSAGRTAMGDMDTIIPELISRYAGQLRDIFTSKAESAFRQAGIPLAECRMDYVGSASTPSDEQFIFIVQVAPEDALKATSLLAAVLSDIDSKGASVLPRAPQRITPHTEQAVLDRLVSAALFNADLASDAVVNSYFSSRPMAASREMELFRSFASSLLSATENVTLRLSGPSEVERQALRNSFSEGWDNGAASGFDAVPGDTLKLHLPASKVKLKLASADPATGGELWVFSNGIRVIYKKTPSQGRFNYSFLLRGGYSEISGLAPGRGEYVQDLAGLWNVAGISPDSFRNLLVSNDIDMGTRVSSTDMVISGSAPSSRLLLLLKCVFTMAESRRISTPDYEWYRKSAVLRHSLSRSGRDGLTAVLDSMVCLGYLNRTGAAAASLDEAFVKNALSYYDERFSGFNDGIIVLTGDLKTENVKKILTKYLGSFKVTNTYASRPTGFCRMQSGTTTYTAEEGETGLGGGQEGVSVVISALMPYSQEKKYAFEAAREILRLDLERAFAGKGIALDYSAVLETEPFERFVVKIGCHPVGSPFCPSTDPLTVLNIVRNVLDKLPKSAPKEDQMGAFRTAISASMERDFSQGATLNEAILLRYTAGKDVIGSWKDKVKGLKSSAVAEVLEAISGSGRVEYMVF